MKALVAVKQVADPNARIRVSGDGRQVDLSGLKMTMNPFDEVAVEEAVRAKEMGRVREVVVVTIGPDSASHTLRQALAMGADRAVHIVTHERIETLGIAKLLRAMVLEEQPDLILLGKQSSDDDNSQTGSMLAGLLGYSQVSFATGLAFVDSGIDATCEVDGGQEVVRLSPPAVITVDLRLNEPRFISLPNIMKAKAKPLVTRSARDFGIDLTHRLEVLSVEQPPAREPGLRVTSIAALVAELRSRGAVQ